MIETVWGVKWPVPSAIEMVLIILVVLLVLAFLILFRYNHYLQKKKMHAEQLFLFKTKQLGLSNYQIKILNGLANMLKLKDSINILQNPDLFELSLGSFLPFLREQEELQESLHQISIDIIKTYEKLYHRKSVKKTLDRLTDLETDILLCFFTEENDVFIGRVIGNKDKMLSVKLFRNPGEYRDFAGKPIRVYLWRKGDAEYTFDTAIATVENKLIGIPLPDVFTRGEEERHPYIDTIISCIITELKAEEEAGLGEAVQINGTIYKMNEFEAIVRVAEKLDYEKSYSLQFELSEFKINITSKVISDRTITEESVSYYTFRLLEMSDPARNILTKYIQERL